MKFTLVAALAFGIFQVGPVVYDDYDHRITINRAPVADVASPDIAADEAVGAAGSGQPEMSRVTERS
jgi:hypothetical protein